MSIPTPPQSTPLSQDETILADVAANLWRGSESVGGKLKITSTRLIFTGHGFNVQKQPQEILISDIKELQKYNSLMIVPNGLLVKTKSGAEFSFVVFGRDKLIALITPRLS